MTWRVACRANRLSLVQTDQALDALTPHLPAGVGRRRFSVKTLEFGDLFDELREGRADFTVVAADELPLPWPDEVALAALLPSTGAADALACRPGLGPRMADLPPGAKVGVATALRRQQVAAARPDVTILTLKGSVEEGLGMLDRALFDALVIPAGALRLLKLEHRIGELLPFATAALQGQLAVVCLADRNELRALWKPVDLRRDWAKVWLVGVGPGEPDLLTVRAARLLEAAAQPVHGAVDPEALYTAAVRGNTVVRVVPGNPADSPMARAERDYLRARLVDVELVPGLPAAT